jgi:hypothetical protein
MSTQKQKFQLFAKLAELGFTYEESAALRRIEMTLQRWGERECGDGSDWGLERDEVTDRPFNVWHGMGSPRRYPVADREAGALRRLAAIVAARNARNDAACSVVAYHQPDCRGCNLYILRAADIPTGVSVNSIYNRGLAVCT